MLKFSRLVAAMTNCLIRDPSQSIVLLSESRHFVYRKSQRFCLHIVIYGVHRSALKGARVVATDLGILILKCLVSVLLNYQANSGYCMVISYRLNCTSKFI